MSGPTLTYLVMGLLGIGSGSAVVIALAASKRLKWAALSLVTVVATSFSLMSQQPTTGPVASARPFPVLPTSKILAIGHFTSPPTREQVNTIFPHEVPDTLQLYLDGKIEQMWARGDQNGPVFLMNVTSIAEAHAILEKLPLGRAKLMEFELIELTPLTPFHMLLTEGWAKGSK